VIVTVGLAVTLAPVVAERAVAGLHVYVVPPLAVNPVDEPLHMATLEPPLMMGAGLTETWTVAVLLQPAVVPVTV